ncbi:hypothetical protein G3567_02390 [Psychroflexus sp. YR1-1]|uniref:Uncharacterized protein n=1 Tax=Psychroflexus aurantiacus TaxID=2709310 RepID=A0A6B3R2P3_9FLAO|nr:hypothetical protein [Psychroflexus aurantiacus]NEV92995.1 hypothetical protein [Psychroflexus aurantiacus]
MKPTQLFTSLMLCCVVSLFSSEEAAAQVEFELKPSQSMSITGKGPGQDAANNPFEGQDCIVQVENIGDIAFAVRTQQKGQKNLKTQTVEPGTSQNIDLPKSYELYLDTSSEGLAKARLNFKQDDN